MESREIGVVLLDLNMPYVSGEELLERLNREHPEVPVIIISGMNQVETAVRCVKAGAFDFFVKAVEKDRLIAGIHRALEVQKLNRENRSIAERMTREGLDHPEAFADILTRNSKMRAIFRYLEAIAEGSGPVLFTGETGTGKELLARALHRLGRPQGPWLTLSPAGLSDEELFAALFGTEGGDSAGMLERAAGGTLYLDEIGDLSPAAQGRLLRLAQDGEYLPPGGTRSLRFNGRLVCSSQQDLAARVAAGEFRKDFYYRLRTHHVEVPPLRRRLDDIPLLLEHFLAEAAEVLGKRKPTVPDELPVLLATYHYPGNVRELKNMVYDAVITHRARKMSMDPFKEAIGWKEGGKKVAGAATGENGPTLICPGPLPTLKEAADFLVDEALRRSKGNQGVAAGLLGVTRQALNQRLRRRGD
jgi:DNA-binding NtrC family response regulator